MAQLLGRSFLPSRYNVHHKDGNHFINIPDNLDLIYHPSHISMHKKRATVEKIQSILTGASPLDMHTKTFVRNARRYNFLPYRGEHEIPAKEEIAQMINAGWHCI